MVYENDLLLLKMAFCKDDFGLFLFGTTYKVCMDSMGVRLDRRMNEYISISFKN